MTTTYQRAGDEIQDIVRAAINRYHPDLAKCEVTVDVLLVEDVDEEGVSSPVLKHNGYQAAATMKVNGLKERALGLADALLTIDAFVWGSMGAREQLALVDHELEHLQVRAEKGIVQVHQATGELSASPKRDDLGRPCLKLRLHDWQLGGFRSVAQRHRESAVEVQAVRRCRSEGGQYYWDWSVSEAVDEFVDALGKTGVERVEISSGRKTVTLDVAAGKRLRQAAATT